MSLKLKVNIHSAGMNQNLVTPLTFLHRNFLGFNWSKVPCSFKLIPLKKTTKKQQRRNGSFFGATLCELRASKRYILSLCNILVANKRWRKKKTVSNNTCIYSVTFVFILIKVVLWWTAYTSWADSPNENFLLLHFRQLLNWDRLLTRLPHLKCTRLGSVRSSHLPFLVTCVQLSLNLCMSGQ